MASFLLIIWYVVFCLATGKISKISLSVLMLIILGTFASSFAPRQSLIDSFFSIDKFIAGPKLFYLWLKESYKNISLLSFLLVTNLLFPFVGNNFFKIKDLNLYKSCNFLIVVPSVGIMIATPFFFQEAGSLSYLAYPFLITILCITILYLKVYQAIASALLARLFIILTILGILYWTIFIHTVNKNQLVNNVNLKDMYICIAEAKKVLPLDDGVATYWNARPIKFLSNFQYYLAQVRPWAPKEGFFLWGNNGYDFKYKEQGQQTLRNYNYIIAPHAEVSSGLWGDILKRADKTITCSTSTLYYFDQDNILNNFLQIN
jgi:hypothetical protein